MTIAPLLLAACALAADARSDAPVILDFTASWCGPCQQMKPAVAELIRNKYPVKAVDYDTSPLVKRYRVTAVPTFVVVDADGRELDRLSGYRPAGDIASMYRKAKARIAPREAVETEPGPGPAPAADEEAAAESPAPEESEAAPKRKLPQPWETVVRIRVDNHLGHPASIEYGSGTIIHSTPDEAIILTCAHIFRIKELGKNQAHPSRFPLKITIELSDGQLRRIGPADSQGASRAQVHMVEAHRGEAIDYDFSHDVGLIRIRPGKRLPSTPVVPADWTPKPGVKMTAVGCSEGHDATPWSTWITKPLIRGLAEYPNYEAMECQFAPMQGRSGGGLYTLDGKLAGVCDFAEPTGGHGLYATPRTIHRFLDKNDLTLCYAPEAGRSRNGAMLAQNERAPARGNRSNVADTLRAQNPDEPRRKRLTIPSPDALKVPPLVETDDQEDAPRSARSGDDNRRKPAWSNVKVASNAPARDRVALDEGERPQPAEMTTPPDVGRDPFEALEPPREKAPPSAPGSKPRTSAPWKPARTASRR